MKEALEYVLMEYPAGFRPVMEVDGTLLASRKTFDLKGEDMTVRYFLANLARHFDADLVLSAGRVTLKPRAPKRAAK